MPKPGTKTILQVAVTLPIPQLFDYLPPDDYPTEKLQPGVRLMVPFGRIQRLAVLIACLDCSEKEIEHLKQVAKVLDEIPLFSPTDMALLAWVSRYYHYPLGDIYSIALPAWLRQGRTAELPKIEAVQLTGLGQEALTTGQLKRKPKQQALLELLQNSPSPLSFPQLAEWSKNWRSLLKPLLAEQWLEMVTIQEAPKAITEHKPLTCNSQQQTAVDTICQNLQHYSAFLLDGVTGSGKTEVYMQTIFAVLQQQKQVLVLVPEITLTPQLEQRFRQRFSCGLVVSHSKLTDQQRNNAWLQIQQGQCQIMLGTRSALFTPLKNPGLIILDEEHDASFKQQEGCRFSARDVAVVRAKMLNIPILLGSATPSLESLQNVQEGRYRLLTLPERAGNAQKPDLYVLDIRNKRMQEGLSTALIQEINKVLAKNEQVLLFLNRRGFAPRLICHSCGWVLPCRHCDSNMVVHIQEQYARCHHCGFQQRLPNQCEGCKQGQLMPLGLGTERIEQALTTLFPNKTIVRLDRDSTRKKGSLESYLSDINTGKADIILGTQMLAKGHHFSQVTLVALLDVDSALFSIDFHATERLAQLVIQVAGRAGRAEKPGRVILQTRHPDQPLLLTLFKQGYPAFAQLALKDRQEAQLPPFSYQALLRIQAKDLERAKLFASQVASFIQSQQQKLNPKVWVFGPVVAPLAKKAGLHRFQLLLQSQNRKALHYMLDVMLQELYTTNIKTGVYWNLDIDPIDLY